MAKLHIFQFDSFLEWIFALELIVLLTATIFGMVAKQMAKSDPYDPMARFYRVFWRSMFKMRVPPAPGLAVAENKRFSLGEDDEERGDGPDLTDPDALERMAELGGAGDEATAAAASSVGISTAKRAATRNEGPISEDDDEETTGGEPPRKSTLLDVKVIPLSSFDGVGELRNGELEILVTKGADDWQINGVVMGLVAERLGVEAYQVSLTKGHNRVRKTLQISGLDAAAVDARLGEER